MEQFTLPDLLRFLRSQKQYDYRGITVLMEILEANKLPQLRMKFTMLSGLHACGLFEVGNQSRKTEHESVYEYPKADNYATIEPHTSYLYAKASI